MLHMAERLAVGATTQLSQLTFIAGTTSIQRTWCLIKATMAHAPEALDPEDTPYADEDDCIDIFGLFILADVTTEVSQSCRPSDHANRAD